MRLIDADALKRELIKAFNCENATKYGNKDAKQQARSYSTIMLYEVADIIEDAIDNAPTIPLPDYKEGYKQAILDGKTNFSRPKGKWLEWEDERWGGVWYYCSNCHNDALYKRVDGTFKQILSDYCPNCGADMRGG